MLFVLGCYGEGTGASGEASTSSPAAHAGALHDLRVHRRRLHHFLYVRVCRALCCRRPEGERLSFARSLARCLAPCLFCLESSLSLSLSSLIRAWVVLRRIFYSFLSLCVVARSMCGKNLFLPQKNLFCTRNLLALTTRPSLSTGQPGPSISILSFHNQNQIIIKIR